MTHLPALLALLFPPPLPADDPPADDWRSAEAGILENHVALTDAARFRKAGECYFSPDGTRIVFQAVERRDDPELEERYYQMYVADIVLEKGAATGIENVLRLSPEGSSNTCGWFHPTEPGVVVFGSTLVPPSNPGRTGYQRDSSRYSWQFPQEMDIVRCELARADGTAATLEPLVANPDAYLAECSIRADGRYMAFCEHVVEQGQSGGDLLALDLASGTRIALAAQSGYDGGPFFSPDGRRLCYRSDRLGNDLLQIFVAELAFDSAGDLLGVEREFQLTDEEAVNWAPFWHPDGRHLVYTTSILGHDNYEVYLLDADAGGEGRPTRYGTRRRRITHAARFDGLPVFDATGERMMWTSQRGPDGSSQVWLADFVLRLDAAADDPPSTGSRPEEEAPSTRPARLQVQDPVSGLYYLYDRTTHELSVYDPSTHRVREPQDAEVERAMELFRARSAGDR